MLRQTKGPVLLTSAARLSPSTREYFTNRLPMASPRRSTRIVAQANTITSAPASASASLQKTSRKRKSLSGATAEAPSPVTPTKKRARPTDVQPVTPSAKTEATVEHGVSFSLPTPRHKAVARIADPTGTNAPLVSPETSRLVTSRTVESVSPSKIPADRTTTQTLLQEACDRLIEVDERLRPLIEKNPCRMFSPEGLTERIDPFESLASGIISQQVSGAAAKSIKAKFIGLFDQPSATASNGATAFPPPSEVARCPLDRLRTAGLSQRKAEYIQGLADKFAKRELSAEMLHAAPYDELVEKLTAVRGLGRWSIEMFACFGLKRMDVFSTGDLGVQRGMAAFAGRDVGKLKSKGGKWKYMSEQEMLDTSAKFAPYRSLFMWLMWRAADNVTDVSTMEG